MTNILVNPGTTTAVATLDIGGGVESPRVNLINGTGLSLYGTAGSPPAGSTVLSVQGVSGGTSQPISVSQIGTTAVSVGSGAMDSGTQRFALATNSPGVTGLGQTTMAASLPVTIANNQTGIGSVIASALPGQEYETVAALQTAQVLGSTGATGDLINGILVVPAATSPGNVLLLDNAISITVFAGGTSSVSNLVPFFIPLGIKSVSGAWKITTGTSVSCIGVGDFT